MDIKGVEWSDVASLIRLSKARLEYRVHSEKSYILSKKVVLGKIIFENGTKNADFFLSVHVENRRNRRFF